MSTVDLPIRFPTLSRLAGLFKPKFVHTAVLKMLVESHFVDLVMTGAMMSIVCSFVAIFSQAAISY